ncbi:MAG: Eco57I restriction-modification methylase domain-containing protein [Methanoregula sp.]|jgi:predicted type IV restriction endonuclease|nr:Eco57I restriction-modification methylase domain-containing protein [Methanoregula sp.]
MAIPTIVAEKINNFSNQSAAYTHKDYNETQLRTDFVNPFFEALGWDVENRHSEDIRDRGVILEEPIRIKETKKRMDYVFKMGSKVLFVVETKKPSISIKDNIEAAHQIRMYMYNANAALGVLTNFREFAVYERVRPSPDANASYGLKEYFTLDDYAQKWDWIEKVFGKQNAYTEIEQYLKSVRGKKKTISVDGDILAEIERWRDILARNIALRNPKELSVDALNSIVQTTIDRILFLRICEDRGIENENALLHLTETDHIFDRLREIFKNADTRYNSGLFHFHEETDWDVMPDVLSDRIVLDDKVLKDIIKDLYEPRSCYRWDIISPAILGQVYEQFLGKVIRLTETGLAKIEYKPEVKKAGGVFYTPEYIVEYIVAHTVGPLVAGKTPKDISKIRILDPACGSGSFLLGAYQYLLDCHLEWYIKNLVPVYLEKGAYSDPAVTSLLPEPSPKRKTRGTVDADKFPIYRHRTDGVDTWKLKITEKKRILLNNIFGVDIDRQAVEVTKLSLMLKVLEDENSQNIDAQLKLFAEPALPRLEQNIKCGNSLVGWDIVTPDMAPDDVKRINPFDWSKEFASVMATGGFDAVIGNPPYVRQEIIGLPFKDYVKRRYEVFTGTADLYVFFFEKGHKLIREEGYFGMICSNKFMKAKYGANLREFIATNTKIVQIVDFGELPVFQNASTFPAIFITKKSNIIEQHFEYAPIKRLNFISLDNEVKNCKTILTHQALAGKNWTLTNENEIIIIQKMKKIGKRLIEYVDGEIFRGIITGLNEAFVIDNKTRDKLVNENSGNSTLIKPFIIGDNVRRYRTLMKEKNVILMPKGWTNTQSAYSKKNKWNWLKEKYPTISQHLEPFFDAAEKRLDKGNYWWELRACEYYSSFEKLKIIYPIISKEPRFTFDDSKFYANDKTFIIPRNDPYLLGLLNSKLIWLFLKRTCSCLGDPDKGGRLELRDIYLKEVPIRTINPNDPTDIARHDRMVVMVTRMLDLNKKLQGALTDQERKLIQRDIDTTDTAIDRLVYELYGLTEAEIKIVEGTSNDHVLL